MNDEEMTQSMIEMLKQMMAKDQRLKYMKRAAHAKGLGLLKGYFTVCPDLPDALRVGIFKESKRYPALIRLSNANPKSANDKFKDIRGFAIKLIDDDQPHFPQDFILASCPRIPFGTWKEFYDALYWGLKNPLYLFFNALWRGKLNKYLEIYRMMRHDASPLDIRYWSVTPYALGQSAVKYTLLPTSAYRSALPKTLTESYLSENMRRHLLRHDATFDFCVQVWKDEEKTPLDDISVEWKEADAPPIKVAELQIPAQDFNTDKRRCLLEALAYSPAHSLPAHRAIGAINEARVQIYRELSAFRHLKNRMPECIPSESDFDAIR